MKSPMVRFTRFPAMSSTRRLVTSASGRSAVAWLIRLSAACTSCNDRSGSRPASDSTALPVTSNCRSSAHAASGSTSTSWLDAALSTCSRRSACTPSSDRSWLSDTSRWVIHAGSEGTASSTLDDRLMAVNRTAASPCCPPAARGPTAASASATVKSRLDRSSGGSGASVVRRGAATALPAPRGDVAAWVGVGRVATSRGASTMDSAGDVAAAPCASAASSRWGSGGGEAWCMPLLRP